jgi:hypothetical protein
MNDYFESDEMLSRSVIVESLRVSGVQVSCFSDDERSLSSFWEWGPHACGIRNHTVAEDSLLIRGRCQADAVIHSILVGWIYWCVDEGRNGGPNIHFSACRLWNTVSEITLGLWIKDIGFCLVGCCGRVSWVYCCCQEGKSCNEDYVVLSELEDEDH